jgi:hypothetical protein
MKFGMYIYIKKRNLTSISGINGHENGIKLFRNLKNTVFDIKYPNVHQMYIKKLIFFLIVWNELPKEVREARSLNCFKAGLDKMKLFKT